MTLNGIPTMAHGYSTPLHIATRSLRLLLPELATTGDPHPAEDTAFRDVRLYRLVSLMVVVLLLAFGAVYKVIDATGINSFVPELSLAAVALAGLAASYRSAAVRRRFLAFVQLLCYLTTFWFIVLAAVNQFAPNYAVGLLFIIPGIGVGYSIGLKRIWPLVAYFVVTIALTAGAFVAVPHPSIGPTFFIGSLVCLSLAMLLVAGARLQVQRQFLASEERYRAVVEQASDGIYLMEASTLRFVDANPAFLRMVGYGLEELQAMTLIDLVIVDRADRRGGPDSRPGTRPAQIAERRLRRRDGTTVYVELHVDRILYEGREALSVVVHDLSQRKQYEDRLIAAKDHAEEIARFKSSLLTNMSHEIRTPLSGILGWSAVLATEVTETQRELVDLIEESGRRLHNTLDAVLELAHLDAHSKQLKPVVLNVVDEAGDVLGVWRERAARKGIELVLDAPDYVLWAHLDASCLRRVLTHIIDNAVKFTDAGRVTVSFDVHVRDLRIHVRDTGIGISPSFLPHLFEEFKQESEGLARRHEGNGLGLAITRRLIDLLGGDITVESRKGEGSCFTVHLPGALLAGERVLRAAVA